MTMMKKIVFLMVLVFSFSAPCLAGTVGFGFSGGEYSFVPQPRLKSPIYDTLTISNNQPLEFSWWNDYMDTSGFIFRLYKGYNMYADDLILKNNLPASADSFQVKAELFEDGKVYTWSLVRISFAGYKSDKSFNSFRAIKK